MTPGHRYSGSPFHGNSIIRPKAAWIMAYTPVHQTTIPGEHLGTSVQPCATQARYPVHRSRKRGGQGAGARKPDAILVHGADLTVRQLPTTPDGLLHSCNLRT